MKKLYSKRLGGEAFALSPEQLDIFKQNGYKTPTPEEVIADAAVQIEPPEGKRAYVVFDCKEGVFYVRTRTATLKKAEVGAYAGELASAAVMCSFLERADPDRPKAPEGAPLSPFAAMLRDVIAKAAANATTADKPAEGDGVEESPEVVE